MKNTRMIIAAVLVVIPLLGCNLFTQVSTFGPVETHEPVNPPITTPTPIRTIEPTSDLRVVNPENEHLYLVVNRDVTWEMAVRDCELLGAHLVTIQSAQENEFVHNLVRVSWLGGSDADHEGTWTWITGEPWEYTNWVAGEPNNHGETGEHYLSYSGEEGNSVREWNDLPADVRLNFVCEWGVDSQIIDSPTPVGEDGRIINPENGHLYLPVQNNVTWFEAVADCDQRGGYLVTIQSDSENDFVYNLLNGSWLGGTDKAIEGTWVWITGEAWEYTNWGVVELNNDGHYLVLGTDSDHLPGDWNDHPGNVVHPYICEWEP